MSNKILLFIPIYNCEKQIVRVLKQLDKEVLRYITEIIIVNNRSKDNSEAVLLEFLKNNEDLPLKILRNDDNYSLGGSHKVAFRYAVENKFDYIIVLHGDDQGDIHDILPLIKQGLHTQYDSILGSRFEKQSKLVNYSKFRIIGNRIFNIFISIMLRKKITDLGSGLNMYKTEYLRDSFYMSFPDNLTFNVYLLFYGIYIKSKFCFFSLTWREDDQVSNARLWSQSMEILKLTMQYIYGKNKLFKNKKLVSKPRNYTFKVILENTQRRD